MVYLYISRIIFNCYTTLWHIDLILIKKSNSTKKSYVKVSAKASKLNWIFVPQTFFFELQTI